MIISIHQPQYLPYIGFFHKALNSDMIIMLDDVPATRKDFVNRNKIRTPTGWTWLTIPVKKKNGVIIEDIEISNNDWIEKHLRSLEHCYGQTPYYKWYIDHIRTIYMLDSNWNRISNLDTSLLYIILEALDEKPSICDPCIRRASYLDVQGTGTERLINLCKAVEADTYLSGPGGKGYMDEAAFAATGIELQYQDFTHPVYEQRFKGFEPNMSILDLLFNHGPKSADIIRSC